MNVLHLPYNVASQIAISVRVLRAAGVNARGIVSQSNVSALHSCDELEIVSGAFSSAPRYSMRWFRDRVGSAAHVLRAIHWSDVVHYHFGGAFALPRALDVEAAVCLGRARAVHFWGSDIRVPEIERAENPYYDRVYPAIRKWSDASRDRSRRIQEFYASRRFACVIGSESMIPHIERDLFPKYHLLRAPIDAAAFEVSYPDPGRRTPVVAHSPSDPEVKGTPAVLAAIDQLHREKLPFEFVLIQNVPRDRALEMAAKADVFLDQFVIGGYGMAAIEAMAMGKPVVCYIRPGVAELYPPGLPIVNATCDTLTDALRSLLLDGAARLAIGRRSRSYAETYHSAAVYAAELKSLYAGLMESRGGGS